MPRSCITVVDTDIMANKLTDNLIFNSLSSTFFVLVGFNISLLNMHIATFV